jgi:ammonium transporter Rh
VLSLVGTTFLWLYWPSFNGGGYTGGAFSDPNFDGTDAGRAITNTIVALLASCCTTFITSGLICGRLNPVDIQNATLAGGVAVGAVARMDIGLGWASVIGGTGGIISTLGYNFIQPLLLSKIGLHDSCGVNNLHGMPAIFGAVVSMIMVEARRDSGLANDSGDAGMKQLYAFLVSLGFCLVAGVVTGLILKVAKSVQEKFASKDEEPHFLDDKYWDIAYGGQ